MLLYHKILVCQYIFLKKYDFVEKTQATLFELPADCAICQLLFKKPRKLFSVKFSQEYHGERIEVRRVVVFLKSGNTVVVDINIKIDVAYKTVSKNNIDSIQIAISL